MKKDIALLWDEDFLYKRYNEQLEEIARLEKRQIPENEAGKQQYLVVLESAKSQLDYFTRRIAIFNNSITVH